MNFKQVQNLVYVELVSPGQLQEKGIGHLRPCKDYDGSDKMSTSIKVQWILGLEVGLVFVGDQVFRIFTSDPGIASRPELIFT